MQDERQITAEERAQILQAFQSPDISLSHINSRQSNRNGIPQRHDQTHSSTVSNTTNNGLPRKNSPIQAYTSTVFRKHRIRRGTEILAVAILAIATALIIFCATTFATSAFQPNSSGLVVNLSFGQYQGIALPGGVSQYLGIRYAATPVRFAPTQPPAPFSGVHVADDFATTCQGEGELRQTDPEDCLFANVFAPTSADSTSKLPVYVFIQGGGLTNSTLNMNGTSLVQSSGFNIVVVTFNYRVGPFGFLASSEIQAIGGLNAGHQDQYQLLQWVQKEISQFGGDPDHVVLGGQSAGAESVLHMLVAYGGVDKGLFHGALMESTSMPSIRNVSDQQFQYDSLVENANCTNQRDTVNCLRGLSSQDLLDAAQPIPYPGLTNDPVFQWSAVIDGTILTDLPTNSINNGKFVHVPTIFGDVTNEGSEFTPRDIEDAGDTRGFLKDNYPTITSSQLDKFSSLYSLTSHQGNSDYWQIASEAYGETRYICPGIHMSDLLNQKGLNGSVWNWRYNVASPKQMSSGLGASHGSEIAAIWGSASSSLAQVLYDSNGIANVVNPIKSFWLSFVRTLDPNVHKDGDAPNWDPWTGQNRILFNLNGTTMETIDKGQMARCTYLAQISLALKQ